MSRARQTLTTYISSVLARKDVRLAVFWSVATCLTAATIVHVGTFSWNLYSWFVKDTNAPTFLSGVLCLLSIVVTVRFLFVLDRYEQQEN